MFKLAPVFALVLLAALQGSLASRPPVVLDMQENGAPAEMAVSSYAENARDGPDFVPLLDEEQEAADDSSRMVLNLSFIPYVLSFGGVSLCLTEVSLEVVGAVLDPDVDLGNNHMAIDILVPSIVLNSDHYIAGGKIKTLPFVGESSAQMSLVNLNISLSYETRSKINPCPEANSTVFDMSLDKLAINFDDLNPGQDSGELVNAMFNSVTEDITKWLNLLLNEPTGKNLLESFIETLLAAINLPLPDCSKDLESDDELVSGIEDDGNSSGVPITAADVTEALRTVVSNLAEKMTNVDEITAFMKLVESFLAELDFDSI